jgi:NRAMP (natural resistance-associated macrophage protein)-like metal ion transporter
MTAPTDEPKPRGLMGLLRILGPGVITGAADDDPSGIATYSQTGAQFGFGMLWTALYQLPLLIAVQEACARIGAVTGQGLAAVIKTRYPPGVVQAVVLLVVAANTLNIGADIGAVAEAARLVVNVPFAVLAIGVSLLVVTLEVLVTYRQYAKVLKWLAVALLAYPATALIVHQPWEQILWATLIPHLQPGVPYLFILVGVFGTSISPYMFFWQASQEVEEQRDQGMASGADGRPRLPVGFLRDLRIDTAIGMAVSELAQWFIIITTASVLFANGVTNITSAADAARALEPLVRGFPNAGQVARDIFATGVVGLGLLGIPVLAGSAAYALSDALGWRQGLSRTLRQAPGFYLVIILSTLIGLSLNFVGINPFKALVFTAVFNGLAAAPLLFLIARMNGSTAVLGPHTGGWLSRSLVWLAFAVMALAGAALLASFAFKLPGA